MKANEDIDKLFREGTEKNYPYDENLWTQVETELPNDKENEIKKSQWKNMFKLLFVLTFILFFETDSIVSFNHYSPRHYKEISYQSTAADSAQKFALVTKAQNAPNKTKPKNNTEKSKNKFAPKPTQTNPKKEITTTPRNEENFLTKARKASTQRELIQEEASTPIESNKVESLTQTKADDFKLESNQQSKVNSFNSVLESEKDSYPTINELSQLSPLGFLTESNYPKPITQSIQKDKLNKLQQKFKKRDYYIELEVGRSLIINKQLSGLNASQNEYRKEAENSRFQQSMGMNILTDVKRLTVGFGFHLSSFHEQLSYLYNEEINKINVTYDTSYSVVNGSFNSNGTPVILIRENINENRTEVTEKVDRELIINNQFKRISLPVSIGYSKTFGRFNAGLRTAVVVNYLYASTGGYIDNNRDNFYRFDEKQQLSDWVVGNRNQLRFGYSLNEFVVIGTSLNHEQDLSSFTQNYSSKFNTYGMGVWLLYRPR